MRHRTRNRHIALSGLLLAALLLPAGTPGAAQTVTFSGKMVHLADVLAHLEKVTGYEFLAQGLGTEIETARKDLDLRDVRLVQALQAVSRAYNVDFFSLDSTGFRVIPLKPDEDKETPAGPFRARVTPPSPTGEASTLSMALRITAPEERQVESISHLGPDFRIVDNFGRTLADAPSPRSLSGARVQLLEYRQRLLLTLPDQRAVRIRSIRGSLVCFRKVTPLRAEFPLQAGTQSQKHQEGGADFEVVSTARTGRNLTVVSRVVSPRSLDVVGQGISREVRPYLVDDQGHVYRHFTSRIEASSEGDRVIREQSSRFERLPDRPMRLVFEVWAREDPSETVPFRLAGQPLPGRDTPEARPEQRPFYHKGGGTLTLQVLDSQGRPFEGEVTLGVARKTGPTAVRWLEVVTDAGGKVKLDSFAPGVYRITRLFRPSPGAKALTDGRGPVEVTVPAGKEVTLPPLKVPLAGPAD